MKRIAIVLIVFAQIFASACNKPQEPIMDRQAAREYANELYNRQLFKQSADAYINYLNNYKLDDREQANISYTVGDIFFERLHDYENAMAYYIRAKYFNPTKDLKRSIDQKIIACQERLGRPEDAQQTLEEATSIDPEKVRKKRPGEVVAIIGTRQITQGDIDFELSQLPQSLRAQYQSKDKKLEFLKQYILTELLYDSAKRKGLDKDAEVIEAAFQAKKQIMAQKLLQQEIEEKVKIDPEDLELYYKANKDKYVQKDKDGNVIRELSFAEVQQRVAQDLALERQQQVYEELATKLMQAEGVKIYEDRLK